MAFQLSIDEGRFLVRLARNSVKAYLARGELLKPDNVPTVLRTPCGVFTTLNSQAASGAQLRGCIGFPYPNKPLVEAVVLSAVSAATEDRRFEPVMVSELDDIVFEVSVLTPPSLITVGNPAEYPKNISVGHDGIIVERGIRSGLLLPQVAVEWGWDEEEFLTQCCLKAWLAPDSWLEKGTKVYKFQAMVFGEKEPAGDIEQRDTAT